MHGLGNDFMVVDDTAGTLHLDAARVRRLSDRHTGVGFDQLLVVARASRADADFDYRIYNADGAEVEHCGNGARCLARFVREHGLSDARELVVNAGGALVGLTLLEDGRVSVSMGVPTFVPAEVPFVPAPGAGEGCGLGEDGVPLGHVIDVGGETLEIGVVAIGNPHAVVAVTDVDAAPVARLGPLLESHPRFPRRVNVGFVERLARDRVRLRVFERGVGETRACGTGACAAVAVGQRQGLLDARVRVILAGGELDVFRPDAGASIEMTGPCSTVFEGHTRM